MPNRPAPAPKSAELLASLVAMAGEAEPNRFELKRLEREAENLVKVDAVAGYTALGAAATLRGDVEAVHSRHQLALRLSGELPEALHNYAASLTKLGEFAKALEVARRAHDRAPADPAVLDSLVTTAIFAGHFREAYGAVNQWNDANPERPYASDWPVEAILNAVERKVFTEERLREVLDIAHETLRSAKVRTSRVEVHADEHEPDSFLFECFVVASPEKAEDLNDTLDAQIRDCPHLMDDPGLRFIPAFIGGSVDGSQSEAVT